MNIGQLEQLTANKQQSRISVAGRVAQFVIVSLLMMLCWAGGAKSQTQTDQTQVNQTDQAQTKKNNLTRGFKIIEGDIQVPESYSPGILPQATYNNNLWPDGIVPFEFDANVTTANQGAMLAAMAEWTAVANVSFPARQNENNFVHIQNSTGNSSAVGMVGAQQIINIVSWSDRFRIAHELGHALGLQHEHSRPDRDTFVRINTNNIQKGQANQFPLLPNGTPVYGPYDFDSVMHYGQCSFSKDCPAGATCNCTNLTITVLPPYDTTWQNKIGQRAHLSALDQVTMSFLYPFANSRFLDCNYDGSRGESNGEKLRPYTTFADALAKTPAGGTLWILTNCTFPAGTYGPPKPGITIRTGPGATARFGG